MGCFCWDTRPALALVYSVAEYEAPVWFKQPQYCESRYTTKYNYSINYRGD